MGVVIRETIITTDEISESNTNQTTTQTVMMNRMLTSYNDGARKMIN
jgi:hypothetical protein